MGPFLTQRRRPAARRGHLPEAVPAARPEDRRHRRRHRPLDAAARHQGAHQQHHGGRDGRRRRRLVRAAARGARDPGRRRHPQLHRRPRGLGAADGASCSSTASRARPRPSLGGHTIGNLLLAAMNSVQGDDFEEAVRQMNRVLAVRGQVVPATATPVDAPRPAASTGRCVIGPVRDREGDGDRPGLADARRRDGLRRRPAGDRRGRPDRDRARQPLHEHHAEPAPAGDRRRAPRLAGASGLRLQRGDAEGRDAGLRPRRPRCRAGAAHRPRADRRGAGQQPVRRAAPRAATRRSRSSCAGRRCRAIARRADRRGWSSTRSSIRTNAHHHDSARLAAALMRIYEREAYGRRRSRISRRPSRGRSGKGPADDEARPMTTAGDEISSTPSGPSSRPSSRRVAAAVQRSWPGWPAPPRRVGEPRSGWGCGSAGRIPITRGGDGAADGRTARLRLGPRRRALPRLLPARPIPGPRFAEPRVRPHAPRVRPARRRGAASCASGSARWRCPRPGVCGAAAASSPGRASRPWARSSSARRRSGAARAGVAPGVPLGARRPEPRHQRRVGESAAGRGRGRPPAGGDRHRWSRTGGWASSPTWSASSPTPAARSPRPRSPNSPSGWSLHRSAVQRALDRIETTGAAPGRGHRSAGPGAAGEAATARPGQLRRAGDAGWTRRCMASASQGCIDSAAIAAAPSYAITTETADCLPGHQATKTPSLTVAVNFDSVRSARSTTSQASVRPKSLTSLDPGNRRCQAAVLADRSVR